MKKNYIFLVAVFFINAAMSQGSFPALSVKAPSPGKHPVSSLNEKVRDGMRSPGMKTCKLNSEMNLGKIIKHQTLRPQDLIQIFDSVHQFQWDTLTPGWDISSKIIGIVYDAKYNMTGYIEQTWKGGVWENSYKYTSTYDNNNNQTGIVEQTWNGSAWDNSYKYSYVYDANNNLTSELHQNWNGSAWDNSSQFINTYDASNNLTNELHQTWSGSAWENSYQYQYTYDAHNNLSVRLVQNWNGSDWMNLSKTTNTYDSNNNLTKELQQLWTGMSWLDLLQSTYTYDSGNKLTRELTQYWNGSAWTINGQIIFTYDANKNQTGQLYQSWDGSNWVNSYQVGYTFDANNFIKSLLYENWNTAGTKIESGDSAFYYYHTTLGINDLMSENAGIAVYPNPAFSRITIDISATQAEGAISILNFNGQEVFTRQVTQPKTLLDITGLPGGVYYVRMTSNRGVATGKFIKQ
jgi:hypothetical protein